MKKSFYLCSALASPSGEMVDTLVSGASASRHVGSSPILGTKKEVIDVTSFFMPVGQPYLHSLQTSL